MAYRTGLSVRITALEINDDIEFILHAYRRLLLAYSLSEFEWVHVMTAVEERKATHDFEMRTTPTVTNNVPSNLDNPIDSCKTAQPSSIVKMNPSPTNG